MKKKNLGKSILLAVLMMGVLGITAFAWTINGVTYRSEYYSFKAVSASLNGPENAYGFTSYYKADGGRTRAEVDGVSGSTSNISINYERRTPWYMPNESLGTLHGKGITDVKTITSDDQVRMYGMSAYVYSFSVNGYMHL